jgi:hypothetical protein
MAVSGMSAPCVALLVGISPRLAFNLLYGRSGRPLRRISPDTARKLLRVTAPEAWEARSLTVPAHATADNLRQLRAAGWSEEDLAELLGVPADVPGRLMGGSLSSCSQLVALRAAAEAAVGTTPRAGLIWRNRQAA